MERQRYTQHEIPTYEEPTEMLDYNGWKTCPIPLRDRKRKISWNPYDNPDENLKVGIHNVQAIFLSRNPEFMDLYTLSDDGTIQENMRTSATEYILSSI